ncbi:uncharacterized protein DUF4247 [Kineococcus xinjiangensis]|uniref:Uncharacterized protein DUF4247 n=1 Tax=Kineococcus xinjiangensis TaxID=512762 RepID=A0A2S6ILZ9_9ACTN|nr:DUF4247 domain-containing protein [Kineococcus xinjiangensis]PPK95262.1 uncharacterized protein DUF4247 [Kineococcus xinjiangensis]
MREHVRALQRAGRGAAAAALAAVLLGGCGIGGGVEDEAAELFQRQSSADVGTAAAYTADADPAGAAARLSEQVRPLDRVQAQDRIYLRYEDDIVRFEPRGEQTLVLVDGYEEGRTRWSEDVGQQFGPGDGGAEEGEGK